MRFRGIFIATCLLIIGLLAVAEPAHARKACAVVSKRISLYDSAYQGIADVLGKEVVRFDLEGKRDRGEEIIEQIRKSNCDVIVPIGSLALDVASLHVTDTPIVYTMVASPPAAIGSSPNWTGISLETEPSTFFSMIKEIMPKATRVGIVYNPANAAEYVTMAKQAAPRYGLHVVPQSITSIKGLPNAVSSMMPRVDALLMVPDPTSSNRKSFEYMLLESARHNKALIGLSKKHVRDGALFSFAIDYRDVGRKTGEMVQRAFVDVGSARSFRPRLATVLVINEKTANRLGLRLDPAITSKATDVYK